MIRIIFQLLLLIHGLIHLLGFVQAFKLARIEGLPLKSWVSFLSDSPKLAGALWCMAFLLFVATTLLFALKKEIWWILAIAALVLSQALIIFYWQEAKFGTIANGLVLIGIILGYATWDFNQMVTLERSTFTGNKTYPRQIITPQMLADLPAPVQKWLTRSGIVGKPMLYTVYLEQSGRMRTSPDGKWMDVKAQQYFTTIQPRFLWIADVKAASFFHLAGRDKYDNGHGHMLIKALSLVTVADAHGKETDQGTMLRYLAEMVWFPSAALSNYISWEHLNTRSAKATMIYGGIEASGIFYFNEEGDVESFEAQRYYTRKEGATQENWLISIDKNGFSEFEGIRIPARSAVTWKLKPGDFTWFELEITKVSYNQHVNFAPVTSKQPAPIVLEHE